MKPVSEASEQSSVSSLVGSESTVQDAREIEDARVGWLELFYDLVLVAWLAHMNMMALESEHFNMTPLILGAGIVVYLIWMTMTTINNLYPASGYIRRLIMISQMFLMLIAMLAFEPEGIAPYLGLVAIGLIYLTLGLAYFDIAWKNPEVKREKVLSGASGIVAALVCFAGVPFVGQGYIEVLKITGLAFIGAIILSVPLIHSYSRKMQTKRRIHLHLLDERWGQLTLITLGESFLLFSETLGGDTGIPKLWLFLVVFITIVCFWRLYFDSAMKRPYVTKPESRHYGTLIVAQFLLLVGLIISIDALVDAVVDLSENTEEVAVRLVVGIALVMVSLSLIAWGRRHRVEGIVVANLIVALVVGRWAMITVYEIDISLEAFVAAVCGLVILYSFFIGLIDRHANRLLTSKLPEGGVLNPKVDQDSAPAQDA